MQPDGGSRLSKSASRADACFTFASASMWSMRRLSNSVAARSASGLPTLLDFGTRLGDRAMVCGFLAGLQSHAANPLRLQ